MNKTISKSFTALGLVAAMGLVQAQSTAFTGWELGAGVGAQTNRVNYQGFLAGHDSKAHDEAPFVEARYGWSVGTSWVLTLGARHDLQKTDFGSTTYQSGGTQTVTARYNTGLSLSLAPGFVFHPDWMAYGKLTWNQARGEFSDTGAPSGRTRHHGHGVGLGLATQWSRHWVGRFELSQVVYSREPGNLSTGKPKSTEASLALGYRF